MIVEVAKSSEGYVPEVSYGTHFFQDLVEEKIYYLAVYPGMENNYINDDYLCNTTNLLAKMTPDYQHLSSVIRVISVNSKRNFRVVMDRGKSRALCFSCSL